MVSLPTGAGTIDSSTVCSDWGLMAPLGVLTPVGGRGEEVANNDSTTELMSLLSRATKRGHIAYNDHTSVNWHTQEYIAV